MICVMQSPFMSQFNFNPSTLPYRFVFPETTTLDAWWPFGIIALFISCTDLFAYGCDSRKGFARASSVIFSLLQVTEDPLTKMFLSQGARETDACILFLLAFAFNSCPSDERHFQMVELVW